MPQIFSRRDKSLRRPHDRRRCLRLERLEDRCLLAGTPQLLQDINIHPAPNTPAYAHDFVEAGGTLFFVADDGATGRELWKSDGTAAGTLRVKDIVLGSEGS
ncbi:MAG TPA: ELWxxDGT repeat protein, partial [Lacipirellula sp.]